MIVSHVKPESWVDTGEAGKIQPSEVAGLVHAVSLEAADIELLRGPQGPHSGGRPRSCWALQASRCGFHGGICAVEVGSVTVHANVPE